MSDAFDETVVLENSTIVDVLLKENLKFINDEDLYDLLLRYVVAVEEARQFYKKGEIITIDIFEDLPEMPF